MSKPRQILALMGALAMATAGGAALGGVGDAFNAASADAATTAKRYRGTRNGKIYVSSDNGRSWRLLTNFGPQLDATRVKVVANKVIANLVLGRHGSFNVRLQPDGRTWRTI